MTSRVLNLLVRTDSEGIFRRLSPSSGKVAAVHERSFTALVGGVPVNFNTVEDALHPLGVLVPTSLVAAVRVDMPVQLKWPGVALGQQVAELEPVIAATPSAAEMDYETLGSNLARLARAIEMARRWSAVTDAVWNSAENAFREPVQQLRAELSSGRVDLASYAAWFGGGEGATPAWDDLCCGVLLADRLFGSRRVLVDLGFFNLLATKTTPASWWQLQFALSGLSSLRIERALRAFGTRPLAAAEIVRALDSGHTSGTDILTGAWLYLTARLGLGVPAMSQDVKTEVKNG